MNAGETALKIFSFPGLEQFLFAWKIIFVYLAPVLPFMLFAVAMASWLRYRRAKVYTNRETVLLELHIPQEVKRSPTAMEAVFDTLHFKPGEGTFYKRWWKGGVRSWYSLELVSFGGEVHFYIWTPKEWRKYLEASFYACYPDIELKEVSDYAHRFKLDLARYQLYGVNYKFTKPDCYPIKTYVEYGLDKPPQREEEKTDPLATMVERLASIGPGEQIWIQIIFQMHTTLGPKPGSHGMEHWDIKAAAKKEVEKIRKKPEAPTVLQDNTIVYGVSAKQMKSIELIERTVFSKNHFDVGIRGMYIAEREHWDKANKEGIKAIFRPFTADLYNTIRHMGDQGIAKFDFATQDFMDMRVNAEIYKIYDAYRKRSWFHPPYTFKKMILTSEELATLFHVPSHYVKTPGLARIPSVRKEAPPNLPV